MFFGDKIVVWKDMKMSLLPSCFSRQDASNHMSDDLKGQDQYLTSGQGHEVSSRGQVTRSGHEVMLYINRFVSTKRKDRYHFEPLTPLWRGLFVKNVVWPRMTSRDPLHPSGSEWKFNLSMWRTTQTHNETEISTIGHVFNEKQALHYFPHWL